MFILVLQILLAFLDLLKGSLALGKGVLVRRINFIPYFDLFLLRGASKPGLEIANDTVANATNIFSLATKNSSLVAKVATRFLYDLDLN